MALYLNRIRRPSTDLCRWEGNPAHIQLQTDKQTVYHSGSGAEAVEPSHHIARTIRMCAFQTGCAETGDRFTPLQQPVEVQSYYYTRSEGD